MNRMLTLPRRLWDAFGRFTPTQNQIATFCVLCDLALGVFRTSAFLVGCYLVAEVAAGLIHHFHLFGFLWGTR